MTLVFRPGDRGLALDVYFLTLGGLALLAVLRATVGRLPDDSVSRLARPAASPAPARAPQLAELETAVALAAESEFDLHFRLRPTLRRVAAGKLRARGIELDAPAGRAAAVLGPDAWEVVRPDRPRPDEQRPRRRTLGAVRSVVEALERL